MGAPNTLEWVFGSVALGVPRWPKRRVDQPSCLVEYSRKSSSKRRFKCFLMDILQARLQRILVSKARICLYRWKAELIAKGGPVSETLDAEVRQLRVKLQQAQRERDILKKALAIFSRQE